MMNAGRPHRVANPAASSRLLGPTAGQFERPVDVSKRSQTPPPELSNSRHCSANRRNGSVHFQFRIPLGSLPVRNRYDHLRSGRPELGPIFSDPIGMRHIIGPRGAQATRPGEVMPSSPRPHAAAHLRQRVRPHFPGLGVKRHAPPDPSPRRARPYTALPSPGQWSLRIARGPSARGLRPGWRSQG